MREVTAGQLIRTLPLVLDTLQSNGRLLIRRHGKRVAYLMSIEELDAIGRRLRELRDRFDRQESKPG